MSRLIDADALEKDGWMMHRTVQVDKNIMSYQTKKPTDFPTIEPERNSGTWILQDGGKATCPFCRYTFRDVWDDDGCDSFCRRCGAMLEGAEQE